MTTPEDPYQPPANDGGDEAAAAPPGEPNEPARWLPPDSPDAPAPGDPASGDPASQAPPPPAYGTPPYAAPPPPAYGAQPPAYGAAPPAYGTQPPAYGAPPPAYGAPPPAYGAQPPAYGTQPPAYGAQPPGYPPPPPGYGAQAPGYGQAGYPPPAYGGNQLAAWGWRALGLIIDSIIILVPAALIGLVTGSHDLYQLVLFVGDLVLGYLNGAQGQTPGKRVVGVKVLRQSDGQLLGGGMGVVRQLAHILDTLACLIGWFWPLWDKERQTFADKVCSTVVIKL